MKKIHPATSIGLALDIGAVVCYAMDLAVPAAALSVVAYFASIKEVSKYTSAYQFIVVFLSAFLLGGALDRHHTFPLMTLALLFGAGGSILRIAFFRIFSYTSYSWFEPLMFVISLVLYVVANLKWAYGWPGWAFPAPVIIFAGILGWGILKDKKQLLSHTRGGYRVQIGQPATDFALPDQDGVITKLSDFRDKRHVLLIFVRGDWCPGCHMMLRTYEKNREKFAEKNVMVMAIGPDPVGVNRGMVEKLGLDFKVLADEKQRTASIYGVQLQEYENDFAEKYDEGIPLPASFLVDKTGIVRYVSRPDKVGEFLNPSLIFPIVEQLS